MSTLTLTLRQPAQLGDRPRGDFVLATTRHIPGTAVRGAFAAAWIARHGPAEPGQPRRDEFIRLFEGGVRFGTLLAPDTEFDSLAVRRHKYRHDPARCRFVDHDQATETDEPPLQCPECESPFIQGKGLRARSNAQAPQTRRRISVAIDPDAEVARDGDLFTREALRKGQEFTGALVASDPADLDLLRELGHVRVGGRRTTHGLADVAIAPDGDGPEPRRIDETTFVLRLRSPGIFTDDEGRPRPEPSPGELECALGVPAAVTRRWTRWEEIGGWHLASGLPKATELAVAAGSTYLISADSPVDPAALRRLSRRGLGLRRHEGFGDLAPEPEIREGMAAKEERERQLDELIKGTEPLRGLPLRFENVWPETKADLVAYGRGDAGAARRLRDRAAHEFDDLVRRGVDAYLALRPEEALEVARTEGWL